MHATNIDMAVFDVGGMGGIRAGNFGELIIDEEEHHVDIPGGPDPNPAPYVRTWTCMLTILSIHRDRPRPSRFPKQITAESECEVPVLALSF